MSTSPVISISQAPRSTSGVFAPGTLIDTRYEVLRPIARGRSCEIVEARHVHTRRGVVLKLLRREDVNRPESVGRIAREAKALGSIQHPSVIAILDAGMCRVHGSYLVLEKLDGRSLDGLLTARGALGAGGALTIMRAMTGALSEMHRQGYVHRDIKPGNIFIAHRRVGGETVQLLDLGVVGEMTSRSGKPLTLVGDPLGTLDYMAPEQLADPALADPRSDLYSLAVLLMTCLGVGFEELFQARRQPRRAHALLEKRSDVPTALIELLDEMLALATTDRPSSADEVLARLGDLGQPPTELLTYAAARPDGDRPTRPEPATQRADPGAEVRRRHLRAPYITPVRILDGSEQIDGRTEDISCSGLLVVTRGIIRLDEKVTVRFALPTSGRVVAVEASPKWRREQSGRTAIGLEFSGIERSAAEAIESYARFVAVER